VTATASDKLDLGERRGNCITEILVADHANARLIERLYAARGASDWAGIAACFADDALWQYPGHNPIGRDYCGPADIVALFKTIQALADRRSFGSNPRYILANDEVAVAYELPHIAAARHYIELRFTAPLSDQQRQDHAG
jgi:ketosteroid isomerase-like protein